jgi:hypothetical protein
VLWTGPHICPLIQSQHVKSLVVPAPRSSTCGRGVDVGQGGMFHLICSERMGRAVVAGCLLRSVYTHWVWPLSALGLPSGAQEHVCY